MSTIFNDPKFKVFAEGAEIMLVQSAVVTSLNRISVVACYSNVSAFEATKRIFSGNADGKKERSYRHFFKGVSGHLSKETARLVFKVGGLMFKPGLDQYCREEGYSQSTSNLLFSLGLSCGEILVNPVDTIRTMWQAGEKISSIPKGRIWSHLFKGAGLNGLRQFGTWYGFSSLEGFWSRAIENYTPLNAHTIMGIVVKSLPQSFQITGPVWVFERLKNELQYRPELDKEKQTYRYIQAFRYILQTQGWVGFTRGFIPKVWSNFILIIGANWVLEQGRSLNKK